MLSDSIELTFVSTNFHSSSAVCKLWSWFVRWSTLAPCSLNLLSSSENFSRSKARDFLSSSFSIPLDSKNFSFSEVNLFISSFNPYFWMISIWFQCSYSFLSEDFSCSSFRFFSAYSSLDYSSEIFSFKEWLSLFCTLKSCLIYLILDGTDSVDVFKFAFISICNSSMIFPLSSKF